MIYLLTVCMGGRYKGNTMTNTERYDQLCGDYNPSAATLRDFEEFDGAPTETYPRPCTIASHELAKLDAAAWATMMLIGFQAIAADESGPAETLEYRNCACGSTLAKVVL